MTTFLIIMLVLFSPVLFVLIAAPAYCLFGSLCWMWGYVLHFVFKADFLLNFAKRHYEWMGDPRR